MVLTSGGYGLDAGSRILLECFLANISRHPVPQRFSPGPTLKHLFILQKRGTRPRDKADISKHLLGSIRQLIYSQIMYSYVVQV